MTMHLIPSDVGLRFRLLAILCFVVGPGPNVHAGDSAELVYSDAKGVVRWVGNGQEVALFGANYCLPSACDYRAAGYVHADRSELIRQDFAHFARMGWDAIRISFWGDWESCDREGKLIANDHLDLVDRSIAEAKRRGLYVLFTPITTYSAWWPDAKPDEPYPGFSRFFKRDELVRDPKAIAAEQNYLRQILNHVNPYTGVALKDEPSVLFIEMINEPPSLGSDLSAGIAYIDGLAEAVRSTGCRKLLFYNVSQDFRMTPAIKASTVPGVSFAWYPTGLNSGHELQGNFLRTVDDFEPMHRADLHDLPKIVYEFDSPDLVTPTMYPAMARAFREVGAQFAAMFSYDMLATAPYNLGWQTHFLNLVYSPAKAVGAIIASEAMHRLPRYRHYGDYPENCRFGPFRVDADQDVAEMLTDTSFLYANSTPSEPHQVEFLQHVVGVGNSVVVKYEGAGAYFLDRIGPGLWRLELYPDAVLVQDPFAQRLNYQTVSSRLIARSWPMTVRLPDLGDSFAVLPLNDGNRYSAVARNSAFRAMPGVYLLSRTGRIDESRLPESVGRVGLREFVCPAAPVLPPQVVLRSASNFVQGRSAAFSADVFDGQPARAVALHLRRAGSSEFREYSMQATRQYGYSVRLDTLSAGTVEYFITAETESGVARAPADGVAAAKVLAASDPVVWFDPTSDTSRLLFSRSAEGDRTRYATLVSATSEQPAATRFVFPASRRDVPFDCTADLFIHDRIQERSADLDTASAIRFRARAAREGQVAFLTIVESDGTSWGIRVEQSSEWREFVIPIGDLKVVEGVKVPTGYPQRWNYWLTPAKGRGGLGDHPRPGRVEHVQFSQRLPQKPLDDGSDPWIELAAVELLIR